MSEFFNAKPLSEYTDDEIKEKLSFISLGTNQNDVNNLINEALKRGIKVKYFDFGSSNFKKKMATEEKSFLEYLKKDGIKKYIDVDCIEDEPTKYFKYERLKTSEKLLEKNFKKTKRFKNKSARFYCNKGFYNE